MATRQATSISQSMFGMDPGTLSGAMYEQQANDALIRNVQLAQLTPWQSVSATGGAAGEMMGQAGTRLIGSMLGIDIEDPKVKRARVVQEALNSLPQDAAMDPMVFGPAVIRGLQDAGLGQDAVMLAEELRGRQLTQAKTMADIQKLRRDSMGIGSVNPKDFTPESVQEFNRTGGTQYHLLKPMPNQSKESFFYGRWQDYVKKAQQANGFDNLPMEDQLDAFAIGSQLFGNENVRGIMPNFAERAGKLGEEERKSMVFLTEGAVANHNILKNVEGVGKRLSRDAAEFLAAMPALSDEKVLDFIKFNLANPEDKRIMDHYVAFVGNVLYGKSGAAVTVSEFMRGFSEYVPMPWDEQADIERKAANRNVRLEGVAHSLSDAGKRAARETLNPYGIGVRGLQGQAPLRFRPEEQQATAPQRTAAPTRNEIPTDPNAFDEWWKNATVEQKREALRRRGQQ